MATVIRPEARQMEILMVGSILLCTLVGTLVGLKLLIISARTRKFPEFAVGAALFSYAALSQPALLATYALGEEASVGLRMAIAALRITAFYVTLLGLSLFTWQVFGAQSRWRQALAAGVAVTGLISGGLIMWATWLKLSAGLPSPAYARIGMMGHYVVTFGWVSLESLRYPAVMRKRQAMELADPAVTNRFFVWGAGEGAASLLVLALLVVTLGRSEISPADPLTSWLVTLAGLVNTLVWWLTFTPPTAYLRWVREGAAEGMADG
jgi:hypothetical protein